MAKFLLIDHSICGVGGHYYEYARHVLEAAEEAGFEPILATNQRFKRDSEIRWRVHPIYRFGFWANLTRPWWSVACQRYARWLRNSYIRCRTRLLYSEWGVLWVLRRQPRVYMQSRPRSLSRPLLLTLFAAACFFKIGAVLRRMLGPIVPGRAYLSKGAARCRNAFAARRTRLAGALGRDGWARRMFAERYRTRQFSRATLRLSRLEQLSACDVVLLPTVSELELTGLAEALQQSAALCEARWHLVFRKSVFPGRPPEQPAGTENLAAMRTAFGRCAELHRSGVLSFYSDTDELSEHYGMATGLPFQTLPIPHTHMPAQRLRSGGPLRVCYLGDARTEKGFQHLPRIVGDLWRDCIDTGKMAFTIQSNYNVPLGEPAAIVARAKLRRYEPCKVRLIEAPLSSRDYWRELLASGINLLPYDSENYYARSSGILAESLAAGVPVVAPAGTWMSRQIVDEIYAHRAALCGQMQVVHTLRAEDLRPRVKGSPSSSCRHGENWLVGRDHGTFCQFSVQPLARVLHISFSLAKSATSDLFEVCVEQRSHDRFRSARATHYVEPGPRRERAAILIHLTPGATQIRLAFRNAAGSNPLVVADLRVEFLDAPVELMTAPSGSVGLLFRRPSEIPDLLREMLRHYSHYRATANHFAREWSARHNAAQLVQRFQKLPEESPDSERQEPILPISRRGGGRPSLSVERRAPSSQRSAA